jgi:2'-5' RNA ligase
LPVISALLIPFPQVDRVVAPHRLRHDPSARAGVPAHVTVHYPWLPTETVDASTLSDVRTLAATTKPFTVAFAEFRWFGSSTLWLAPSPDQPLRHLSERSAAMWPELPLYGGQFDEVVPHLTVGDLTNGGDEAALRQVEIDLVDILPLRTQASELWWMAQDQGGQWTRQLRLTLGT